MLTQRQLGSLKRIAAEIQGLIDEAEEPGELSPETASARVHVGEFLACNCVVSAAGSPRLRARADLLFQCYEDWCELYVIEDRFSRRQFGSELARRGFDLVASNGVRYRMGLALKEE